MGADAAAEEQFGPYLVYERLGVGGMATVHRALERGIEGFERIVALKRLLPHLAADATFIKSFVREAKLASLLNHVNIVQIFELGRVATQYFISMEYIDGRDIRRILRHARKVSGPPPIHVTVGLLLQLCDALDYAHHKLDDDGQPMGLVHRDVSPSNLLVTSAGQVKIIDFGIAKAQSSQLRTQTGRVKGKLAYMAPEALAGRDLDARSDLFAVGVIAHELLTARPLFASKNEYQTLMKVQRGEVMPPSTFNQGCPPELDAVVLRTLARDPDDRFRHAGALRDELHAMRKQYNLQTSNRDVASWLEWAFELEAPSGFAANTEQPSADLDARLRQRTQAGGSRARTRRPDDDEAVDLAWGGHDEHGSGEPVVLDDVPDVSAKHLQHASALGAEVRLDLDDLADDIPTSVPSHGKPTVDLSARTATTPLRPPGRSKRISGVPPRTAPRGGGSAGDARPQPSGPMAAHAVPAGDDGATMPNAEIAPELRSALVPSRVRTITMPPRGMPSSSAPPRTIAASLPPRIAPGTGESSRGVPVPMPASRSGAASRSGPLPVEPSRRAAALAPSQGIPVAIDPSYVGPAPRDRSRSGPLPIAPSRSGAFAMPQPRSAPAELSPPRSVPSSSAPPRERRPTSPGAPPPDRLTPTSDRLTPLPDRATPTPDALLVRDTLIDMNSTERTPVFALEDLANAADTMPAMPAMSASLAAAHATAQPSEAVVRFRAPSTPPPIAAQQQQQQPPAPPPPPPPREPAPAASDAAEPAMTTTRRQRLITPATALFAEPEADSSIRTAAHPSTSVSNATIPDVPQVARRRVTLVRVLLVVICLAVVGAATAAAALYLTDDDAALTPRRTPTATPDRSVGTVRFDISPVDAAITINGKLMHTGAPWSVDLIPGVYQIEIVRDGYMGWLTSIDVEPGQHQALPVALEAVGSAVVAEATLVLRSTPVGLDITVDGAAFGKTPAKLTIHAGRHSVALRAGTAEVWRREIDARASAVYEYHPAIIAPAEPAGAAPGANPDPPSAPASGTGPGTAAPGGAAPGTAAADPAAVRTGEPAPGAPGPPPPADSPPPAAAATATAASAAPGTPGAPLPSTAPQTVPTSAVNRISGELPRLTGADTAALPAEITAKLCIDDTGRVTGAGMTTPLDPALGIQIIAMLRTWQYAPYQAGGVAQPACFAVTFRPR